MSKIEIGRWSDQLRRMLGMAGVESVAADLAPEVSPVITLEDNAPEWQFLKGVRLVSASGSLAAVAAQTGRYAVINPAGSGMIATVTKVHFAVNAIISLSIRFIATELGAFTTLQEAGARDSRWGNPAGATVSPITFSAENNAAGIAGGFLVLNTLVEANKPYFTDTPVVLAPGSSLFWASNALNTATRSSVDWTERAFPVLEQ